MTSKSVVLFVLLALSAACFQSMTFDAFITKFNKNYTKGSEEYNQVQKIFNYNVQQLNAKNCSTCGITKFFDIAPEQFKKDMLTLDQPTQKVSAPMPPGIQNLSRVGAPRGLDWRTQGVITGIRDQGKCGCCWAFATVAVAESSLIMKGLASQSIDLSEQYLLKCTPGGGCDGGYLEDGLAYAVKTGVPKQSAYPYSPTKSYSGICSGSSNIKVSNAKPLSFYDLSDADIKSLLMVSPLAIAIDSTDWEYYTGGIWQCSPTGDVNHAVLLVGYTSDGQSWIIKNQWGNDWGENGYMYVSTNSKYNCKIGVAVHMLAGSYLRIMLSLMILALLLM